MHDMELLNERGKTRADAQRADKALVPLYLPFTHGIAPAVAGIEVGRFHAGFHNAAAAGAGIALLVASGVLENWATYVTRFYERSIRLQKDRHQTAVTNGPYSFVRHPG